MFNRMKLNEHLMFCEREEISITTEYVVELVISIQKMKQTNKEGHKQINTFTNKILQLLPPRKKMLA